MPVSSRKTYSMTDPLPDINLNPPDDCDEEDEEVEFSPDDLDDSYEASFDDNDMCFGGRNYP